MIGERCLVARVTGTHGTRPEKKGGDSDLQPYDHVDGE